ncbi:hypothetical protein MWN34_11375 [Ancylobacter sp. 6x-1]|uniref:Uncharacterized protein n=1 Tax=Ancylobacter crimeensis TaxID=2579147 RepID=A0ABT0DC31_9HYPH|nr:hypothetical protein [Ancylobacter crimeensis]MCK0197516.1 hypothetical protein [Ancylobacter crimeensis]
MTSHPFPPFDGGDDEPPPDDPRGRRDFEAALGTFLVAFNRIEALICDLIVSALGQLGRDDLAERCCRQDLARQLDDLELIGLAVPGMNPLPLAEIRALVETRARLTQGGFAERPFDGAAYIRDRWAPHERPLRGLLEDAGRAIDIVDRLYEAVIDLWTGEVDDPANSNPPANDAP